MELTDKEKIDLAITVAKEVIPPTIKLIKGRLKKKSVKIRLLTNAVFTFYGSIPIEDYNSIFVKKISVSKVDKNKLEINGISVRYSISPNVKPTFPVILGAEYGESVLNEELLSVYTTIDQIRLFIYPLQEQNMSLEDLENFITAFDNFLGEVELSLRNQKKIPLNMIVKHLIIESDDTNFLRKIPQPVMDESLRIYRSNSKMTITYTKLQKLLEFIECIW